MARGYNRTPGGGSGGGGGGGGGGGAYESIALAASGDTTGTTDTAAIQSLVNAAAAFGGGTVRLGAGTFYTDGTLQPFKTGVRLVGRGRTATVVKLANGINGGKHVLASPNFDLLTGTDTPLTGVAYDFGWSGLTVDGNKANNASAGNGIAVYGYGWTANDFEVRNTHGYGLWSEWSQSSVLAGNPPFEAFATDFRVNRCDGGGILANGPHDAIFSDFIVHKCGTNTAGDVGGINITTNDGRANGMQFIGFHIWGGTYDYGIKCQASGVRFDGVIEGGQVAEVWLDAAQIQFKGHVYSGGIQTANVPAFKFGHTGNNLNGIEIDAVVENCGGGIGDTTFLGDNNRIRVRHYFYSGATPTVTTLGFTGTVPTPSNRLEVQTVSNGFKPTTAAVQQLVGQMKVNRTDSAANDTRDLMVAADESGQVLFRIDSRGRIRAATNTGAPIPSIAAGANAGTGTTVSLVGNDIAGKVTVTTGTTPSAGTLATVTFSGVFGNAPYVVITPKDALGAALQVYNGTATTGFSIKSAQAPAASTAYTFDYVVVGA